MMQHASTGAGVKRTETNEGSTLKLSLTVRSYEYMKNVLVKMSNMELRQLNLVVDELESDESNHLACLYQVCKFCNLTNQKLEELSLTYKADNSCDNNNPARIAIITNLLNQVNWETCKTVNVNLHFNYINGDSRLNLLTELPLVLTVHGAEESTGLSKEDARLLLVIEQNYSYLGGCL